MATYYFVLSLLSALFLGLFLLQSRSLRRKKKALGKIWAYWPSDLSPALFVQRLLYLLIFLVYPGWAIYQTASSGKVSDGAYYLMWFLVLLNLVPGWKILIGKEGILYRRTFIPWSKVRERRIIPKRKRTILEIRGEFIFTFSRKKILFLPLPKKMQLPELDIIE